MFCLRHIRVTHFKNHRQCEFHFEEPVIGITGLLMYLRRRSQSMPNTILTEADNQKIDALLNQDRKDRLND
jgi:hypothetical protein